MANMMFIAVKLHKNRTKYMLKNILCETTKNNAQKIKIIKSICLEIGKK